MKDENEDPINESLSETVQQKLAENETTKKDILEKTAKEYFSSAKDELKKERYNSAVVLFFKALVAFIDLYIYQKTGKTPSSHTERFRITQKNFQDIYDLLDKDFPFYQDIAKDAHILPFAPLLSRESHTNLVKNLWLSL